ncbi:MAG: 30S ribosomal protein S5 [Candidatus Aenigmarchaeota archaeon]|nr:30S ribosomal protein S5 [Candidatus Aenigmarchaeota archaeon]
MAELPEEKNVEETQSLIPADVDEVIAAPEEAVAPAVIAKVEKEVSLAAQRGLENWKPKTELGRRVMNGEIKSIDYVFQQGWKILEAEIVDMLLPGIENDIILVGGATGKGGGIRRIPGRRTARMHKSGRRFKTSCLVVVGNKDGYVGVGMGKALDFRQAAVKAIKIAKLSLIPVQRGCGSWECGCRTQHTLPATIEGKRGSVRVMLKPAPRGVGLVVSDEIKKMLSLAGFKDVWIKSQGQTQARVNHINAVFDALKKLNAYKFSAVARERCAIKAGSIFGTLGSEVTPKTVG